jgi:hypothetical protein
MPHRHTVWLATGLWVVSMGLAVAGLVLDPGGLDGAGFILVPASFATVGAFLAGRRPANPVGWLLAGGGVVIAFLIFTTFYVDAGLFRRPGSLPGAAWLAWAASVVWHPSYLLLVLLLLLFPHGRLLSPRWRPLVWLAVAVYGALAVSAALAPAAVGQYFPAAGGLPFRPPAPRLADGAFAVLEAGQLVLVAVAVWALLLRLRRARGDERQQIKWFVYSVALVVAAFIGGIFWLGDGRLAPFLFPAIPLAAAVGVLKYRLYDIDRIINRTVVYGALTVILAAGYVLSVVGLGQVLGEGSSRAVAGATLACAAAFGPLRRRIQAAVNQRFDRARYDAGREIAAFSARLREQVDLDTLTSELLTVVEQTMQPTRASLWLRPSVTIPERKPATMGVEEGGWQR